MSDMNTVSSVIAETPFGKVRGLCVDGISAFRAIPYSQPRSGVSRFDKPSSPPCWDEVYDATQPGTVCPQLPSRLDAVMGACHCRQDEDSLHVNIWVPQNVDRPVPVLVFIHGGAFMTGGGSLSCYDGHELAKNSGMAVVTMNYRLGIWGFMPVPELDAVNLGLHDQIAALRWIRQAIGAFKGDPQRVTVVGQSAGAYSIAVMLGTPIGQSLFDQAILMSAPLGLSLKTTEESTAFRSLLLKELGYPADAVDKLRVPTSRELLAALQRIKPPKTVDGDITPPFMPVIDGDLIPRDPIQSIAAGSAAWCKTVIGITREEYFSFSLGHSPLDSLTDSQLAALFEKQYGKDKGALMLKTARARRIPDTPRNVVADMRSEADFIRPAFTFADSQIAWKQPQTYFYHFDWQSPLPELGAGHCLDLPFLFGNPGEWAAAPMLQGANQRELETLTERFQQALSAFVYTGEPNGENILSWPSYQEQRAVMHFDKRISVIHHLK